MNDPFPGMTKVRVGTIPFEMREMDLYEIQRLRLKAQEICEDIRIQIAGIDKEKCDPQWLARAKESLRANKRALGRIRTYISEISETDK